MKEDRFRKMFADFGTLTDCTLKFTKDGKFRKFGFIGFKTEEDADKALKHFNKSFVDTSRVTVSHKIMEESERFGLGNKLLIDLLVVSCNSHLLHHLPE